MYNKQINKPFLWAMLIVVICFVACKKESSITPETIYDGSIKLPQGWSIYDTTIKNFYDSTGTYIAYKFSNESDLRFFMKNITSNPVLQAPSVYAVQVDSSKQGDIDTLNMAVDYIINGVLRSSYSNKLLRQLLPYKILLYKYGRALTANVAGKPSPTGYDTASIVASISGVTTSGNNMVEGFNCAGLGIIRKISSFTLPGGYSAANKMAFHQFLWIGTGGVTGAVYRGKIPVAPGFYISDYAGTTAFYNAMPFPKNPITQDSLCKSNGLIVYTQNPIYDYENFIKVIATKDSASFESTYLIPANDPNGLRRRKRDAIVNYFRSEYNYNIINAWNR